MDRSAIDQFERGGGRLRAAIRGLSPQDLLWQPPADAGIGLWSIHEIVIHLQDSDLVGVDRMKRIIAEENPLLVGYNETLFARRLGYDRQLIEDAITLLDVARRQFARVLRTLPAEAFDRTGVHTEVGKVTLGKQVQKYDEHLEHHLAFIHKKRARLGKALKE